MQKGSAQLLIILVALLVLIGSGIYFFQSNRKNNPPKTTQYNTYNNYDNYENYSNQSLGFSFKYAKTLTIKEDTEQDFNKRGNGDFRKNFKGYVGYEPGRFLGAVVVLEKEDYETNPFTLWIFDNPNELSIDTWHHDYWYYPFVWGDFTSLGKYELAPDQEATISGQTGKSKIIDYQVGKPKFIYVSKDKKMYLFRIIGESGDKILENFKFLNQKVGLPSDNRVCAQVITPAKNLKTGECKEFGTPCDVPRDWVRVGSCSLGEDGCVKDMQFSYRKSDYKKGQIVVYFKPDIDESTIKRILNDYGLDFRQRFSSNISIGGIVNVDVGKEFEVACKLKQNKNIELVDLSVIIKIPDCTKGPC